MKYYQRLFVGALSLALAAAQLPVAYAADTTSASQSAASQPGGTPPTGTPPTGTPPTGSPSDVQNGSGTMGTPADMHTASYSDVTSSDWFYNAVSFVSMRRIMTGNNGSFNPNTDITRGEFITAVYNAAGSPDVTSTCTFTDVSASDDCYKAVCWAQANNIASGTSDTSFSPSAPLTRETAMTFLYRAFDKLSITADTPAGTELDKFNDKSSVSSWSQTAMETLIKMGYVSGTSDTTLEPSAHLTNAQTASLLYGILKNSTPDGQGGHGVQDGQQGGAPNGKIGQSGGQSNGSSSASNGTSATTISTDSTVSDKTYTSSNADENALRIDGAAVTLSGITVNKTSGDTTSADSSNFYGSNAGILVLNKAVATITNADVNTSVSGANAVFSYGSGTTVNISDSTITTSSDNSGGIQTAGGGTTNASNLTINTSGNSSAAIRSDRGGGTVSVDGGTYTTNGSGSPAIYSTAAITVKNATLTATNSEGVVVEGKNSVALENCDLSGNMTGTYKGDSTENIHNIMIYQSMSGDADVGTSSFSATGGSITANAGDMFYVTNTNCKIYLSDVDLALANDNLLTVAGNSSSRGWGTEGANGGTVAFTADDQTLEGDITCDSISTLTFDLTNGSSFTGSINTSGEGGTVDATVDEDSTWTLTGDCYLTTLTNNGTIDFNGYTIYLSDGTTLTE